MTEEILRQVLEKKRGERRREETAAKERKAAALSVPEVAEAHREYVYALHESLRYGGDERKRRAEKAYAEYTAALENAGFSERDFEPRTLCPICGDTGMHEGKLCSCVHDDLVRALGVACDLSPEGETLSDLARSALGSQAEKLKAMYARMSTYAEKFPDVNRTVIVCTGKTGTGKTALATALSRTLIRRGHSAKIMSAMTFNSLMLKCHTAPYSEREGIMSDVLGAELLVIDDLGTEPRYNNVTCEYLLLVIEDRTAKHLATLITTNLSPENILHSYNERIYSRLFDKRRSLTLAFDGDDLRLK